MVRLNSKLLLSGLAILVSAALGIWYIHKHDRRENFKIETSIEPQKYITAEHGDVKNQDKVSLKDGMPDGYGVTTRADGSVYVGNFVDGKSHGNGKITYPGGASYEGEFSEGKPHGKGTCTYSTGESEECIFLLGQRQ